MESLRSALAKTIGAKLAEHPEAIAQQLAADVDEKAQGIVILVDQLEEIVSNESGRLDALDLLSRLAEAPTGLRVVVIARRDNLDDILGIDPQFSRALSRGVHPQGQHRRGRGGRDYAAYRRLSRRAPRRT
jgi:hypothetical protein